MSLRRLIAIARKELLHVVRDPRSLAMAIGMPMLMLVLFGYALTFDVDRVPIAVLDRSNSVLSRELISRFAGCRYFSVRLCASNYAELEKAIDRREVWMAVVVPEDFARRLDSGRNTTVQLVMDGSDANAATIALGYAEAVCDSFSERMLLEALERNGRSQLQPPVDLRARAWFNEAMKSRHFLVPGLIAVIMMILSALLTSLTVAREWERGTMERLIATPVRGSELLLGKLVPYFFIGMLDVALAVGLGEFVFRVPLRGNALLVFGVAAVFLIGTLWLGLLISIVAKNQLMANQLAMVVTFVPSFLLSGLMFSISNMPWVLQAVTYLVPARYFVSVMRGIYLKGLGVRMLGLEILLLAIFAALVAILANAAFRRKL
ncbi:MAG TPA: ABC transporter permease [Verrucomicrobiota bacterium]|mgnify:CR=1 FL=1|nr:ABC transporter permease [Verrucomicrobiota bacterium]